jgi:superfamily II DNA or RNA helicase
MSKKKTVVIYKTGNMLFLDPTTDRIFELLKPVLSFDEKCTARGYEKTTRERQGLPVYWMEHHTLFVLDHKDRIATNFGFWKLIRDTLRNNGYIVKFKDMEPPDPSKFKPRWENLKPFNLRPHQDEFLKKVMTNRCGRIDCPPGFGKTFMIGLIASLFPKARIDVVTRRVAVLRDRIYPELIQMVGDVGIRGGKKNIPNKRVMCYTVGSMSYAKATDCDILFGDECHELAADFSAQQLSRWTNSRNYGLSASHDVRYDNKDLRMHGIFGPVIFRVSYEQAMDAEMVVPIKVMWSKVVMDYNPCGGKKDVEKERLGVWKNDIRNATIAEDANQYDDDTQVLITCRTLEHAMNLKKFLPNFTLVYMENGLSEQDRYKYYKGGFCPKNEPLMDLERRQQLTKDFEKGKLKKVICTTVWNVGVSFNKLNVLIRADGGGSTINDIQIPGRVSRIAEGKVSGVVHDYLDSFDRGMQIKSKKRAKTYQDNKWEQVFPTESHMKSYLA